MKFKVKVTARDTFEKISIWLIANFADDDYALSSFHGWLIVEVFDDGLATMFKLTWYHTIDLVDFVPK